MLTQTFGVANKEHYGMLWYFLEWSVETVSNINCSTVVFILLDFLQTRGVIFTLSLFSSACFLSGFGMKNVYRSFFTIFSTYCNLVIAIFILHCLVAEVRWLFPDIKRINKTAKHWTIINMRVEPEHNTEWTSATCSSVKIVNICSVPALLSLVTLYLISFPFIFCTYMCLLRFPSRTNFRLKVSRPTCYRYCFNCYLHYHHIIYSVCIRRHARFVGVSLFSGVTFTASHYIHVHVYALTWYT